MEQFCFHLGLSVPKDPITLWPVRSLWAPFNMSEASGRWFYNCVLLASEDKTQASSSVTNRCYLELELHQQQWRAMRHQLNQQQQ